MKQETLQIVSMKRKPKEFRPIGLWGITGDKWIKTLPQARPYIGDFFEEATSSLFSNAYRLQTLSTADVCPDLYDPDQAVFFEVKSVGRSRHSLLYQHRIEKYDTFTEKYRLYYVFWRHHLRLSSEITSLDELRVALANVVDDVIVVSSDAVHRMARTTNPRETSYSGTHGNPGNYFKMNAYTITAKMLRGWEADYPVEYSMLDVYKHKVQSCAVHGNII